MSTLKVNTIQDASGGNSSTAEQIAQGRCKVWVNFNGRFATSPYTEANGGIRSAFNVSSVTDNGTGDYTVNFSSALANANYVPVCMTLSHDLIGNQIQTVVRGTSIDGPSDMSASSCRITRGGTTGNHFTDGQSLYFAVFGD